MKLRKWYFGINKNGIHEYEPLIRAAVSSCRNKTDLTPICLYDGDHVPLLDWLTTMRVKVIRHRVGIVPQIESTTETDHWKRSIATGAYLRVDIPLLEQEDEFVLYTDVDVLFFDHPTHAGEPPEFFAAAPESDPTDWSFVNTGSMIMNVPNLRRENDAFVDFIASRLTSFAQYGHGTYDQGAMNAYYRGRWSKLPLELNWKPYWGLNPRAQILHFHGPKPVHIRRLMKSDDRQPDIYKHLYGEEPLAFAYYLGRFDEAVSRRNRVPVYTGYIDELRRNGDQVAIRGWAMSDENESVSFFRVVVDGAEVKDISVGKEKRPGVQRNIKEAPLDCGFRICFNYTGDISPEKFSLFPENSPTPLKPSTSSWFL